MQESSLTKIREKALSYDAAGSTWHFHILSPACLFNLNKEQYAFVLEGPDRALVHFSGKPEKELGDELSPLLHKLGTVTETSSEHRPSKDMKTIIERAKELNKEAVAWHHHVLFPGCRYEHDHSGKYVVMLEDPIGGLIYKSFSEQEPTAELAILESLFYAQR